MSKDAVCRENPVSNPFWIMVGGNSLSPPPAWDHFLSMTDERNKVGRDTKAGMEFKEARKEAKVELKSPMKTNKETFKGGLAAWRRRNGETETTGGGEDGDKAGRDD